ncbi:MAG: molecular chaperone TorD family protein [Spirochaetaceae bacterium]|jgi:hypothetical protein|nr:molecular chaperone TorD family protein [Spirochaetaceae bacterium]
MKYILNSALGTADKYSMDNIDKTLGSEAKTFLLLQMQTEIMENIAKIQESVRNAVLNRQWTDFESLLQRMNQYGDKFQELEAERTALFEDLTPGSANPSGGFYAGVAQLPEAERRNLTELYRNLKLRTLKVRRANESLLKYLDEAKTTVDSFLDAACPDRKNRFYTRRGAKIPTDMRSIVINHSL